MTQPEAQTGSPNSIRGLTAESRSILAAEVRFLLREMLRAEDFPSLARLAQLDAAQPDTGLLTAGTLPSLAREIETIRHKLPEKSQLLKLANSVGSCRGMDLMLAPAASAQADGGDLADTPNLSATTKLQILKSAAAAVDVEELSVGDLSEPEQASYFKYCLGMGDYGTVISALKPRTATRPRAWVWGLLVASMRLSQDPEFKAVAAQYHAWMESHYPEALNLAGAEDDRDHRKFNADRLAAVEARELAGA
jgi:hypothetical protein